MERELLLLGLLRSHEMHGYQLNELIDSHVGTSIHLTKPTAYRLLGKMAKKDWITYREEREGNRPPRRVYAIAPQGEAAFQRLLRESLAHFQPDESRNDISLAFLDVLSTDEALPLLGKRRAAIEGRLQAIRASDRHHGSFQLVLDHQAHHLAAELAWLEQVIAQLESGSAFYGGKTT
jgi:DNA-binding PadR family transcriptional regulator